MKKVYMGLFLISLMVLLFMVFRIEEGFVMDKFHADNIQRQNAIIEDVGVGWIETNRGHVEAKVTKVVYDYDGTSIEKMMESDIRDVEGESIGILILPDGSIARRSFLIPANWYKYYPIILIAMAGGLFLFKAITGDKYVIRMKKLEEHIDLERTERFVDNLDRYSFILTWSVIGVGMIILIISRLLGN